MSNFTVAEQYEIANSLAYINASFRKGKPAGKIYTRAELEFIEDPTAAHTPLLSFRLKPRTEYGKQFQTEYSLEITVAGCPVYLLIKGDYKDRVEILKYMMTRNGLALLDWDGDGKGQGHYSIADAMSIITMDVQADTEALIKTAKQWQSYEISELSRIEKRHRRG
jgi:hypothetical protein